MKKTICELIQQLEQLQTDMTKSLDTLSPFQACQLNEAAFTVTALKIKLERASCNSCAYCKATGRPQ